MKLHKGKIIKPALITAISLILIHIAARITAGIAVLDNVYSPSETEASLFWMGFWQFRYTSDRYIEEWNMLEPMDVIAPHVFIVVTVAIIALIIGAIRYFMKTNPANRSAITLGISIFALGFSIFSFMINVVVTPHY